MYIETKSLPDSVRSVLARLGSAPRDLRTHVESEVSYPHAYADGCRARAVVINLATGEFREEVGSWGGANPFQTRELDRDAKFALPAGFVALTSTNSGKRWDLHVNPENAAPLLPTASQVAPRDRWILYCFRALTSAGRKNEFARAGKHAPTEEELASLAARGLLKINRAGAAQITTEGRNALGAVKLCSVRPSGGRVTFAVSYVLGPTQGVLCVVATDRDAAFDAARGALAFRFPSASIQGSARVASAADIAAHVEALSPEALVSAAHAVLASPIRDAAQARLVRRSA